MGLGNLQERTNFEVMSFNRCRNIIGNPKNLVSFPSPRRRPLFNLGVILYWALAIPSSVPNLKSLASVIV